MSKSFVTIAKITHHCLNFQFPCYNPFICYPCFFFQVIIFVRDYCRVVVVFVYMLEVKSESTTLALGHAVLDTP